MRIGLCIFRIVFVYFVLVCIFNVFFVLNYLFPCKHAARTGPGLYAACKVYLGSVPPAGGPRYGAPLVGPYCWRRRPGGPALAFCVAGRCFRVFGRFGVGLRRAGPFRRPCSRYPLLCYRPRPVLRVAPGGVVAYGFVANAPRTVEAERRRRCRRLLRAYFGRVRLHVWSAIGGPRRMRLEFVRPGRLGETQWCRRRWASLFGVALRVRLRKNVSCAVLFMYVYIVCVCVHCVCVCSPCVLACLDSIGRRIRVEMGTARSAQVCVRITHSSAMPAVTASIAKIGTVRRRLAFTLVMNDTHKLRSVPSLSAHGPSQLFGSFGSEATLADCIARRSASFEDAEARRRSACAHGEARSEASPGCQGQGPSDEGQGEAA